ncbi:MAG: hypothetical protein LC540_16120 [Candidatus Thiodiazotropha sp.]|nr:hypothetical protein [Candidatus Thiodiazotropha sp.]
MVRMYQAQAEDISTLNALQLTRLLKLLLHQEARRSGIDQNSVDVALNINVPDGGEDGRIEWKKGPASTDYLPHRFVLFQNKASNMLPSDCAKEVVNKGKVKPQVDEALKKGAAYILFTTQLLNQGQKKRRIDSIRQAFRDHSAKYASSVNIKIYDASMIEGWVNLDLASITAVLEWVGKPIVPGLHAFDTWSRYPEHEVFEFAADDQRRTAISELRQLLSNPKESARIIGSSGLGKTRLAFEIFNDDANKPKLSEQVVYVDSGSGTVGLPGVVSSWIQQGLSGVLVVDNCDLSLHQRLRHEVTHGDSRLSLLTMDYNPDRDEDSHLVALTPMPDEPIKTMLTPTYGDRISDLDRIVSFAQGFPQMAVLLAKARLEKSSQMGSLNDDELLKRMLWGNGDKVIDDERILQSCALFDKFGLLEKVSEEGEFIATNIARTDMDSLYECVKRFEDRGVVNSVGRYAQVIPKPLAIRLAADWWKKTRKEKQVEIIGTEMPGQLEKSFCNQIAKLDFLPQVKTLTAELCGEQGPFGQAEVILSNRGSRLFRALVEVNPYSTAEALHSILKQLSDEQLKEIAGNVRHNLVWSLEKLSFRDETFDKSAKMLLRLAANENESWSNNATGQFKQLFRVFLSGTAAPPEKRLDLIDEALASENKNIRLLAIDALSTAIDSYGGSRTVGAEYQGSGPPLEEWRPRIWQEAFDYWIAAINRLAKHAIEYEGKEGDQAKNAIGGHIRGLMHKGRDVVSTLDQAIRKVVKHKGKLWPAALESIKHSLSYDQEGMPPEGLEMLHSWQELLMPDQLEDKVKLLVSKPPFEHEEDSDGEFVDIAAENAKALAIELADSPEQLLSLLPVMLTGEQRQGFTFGMSLMKNAKNPDPNIFLVDALDFVRKTPESNISLLLGVLSWMNSNLFRKWEETVSLFANTKGLERFYPSIITTGSIQNNHLNQVIGLIESKKIDPNAVRVLGYGRALESVQSEEAGRFSVDLSKHSVAAAWLALDLLSMYCYGNDAKFVECAESFKSILVDLKFDRKLQLKGQLDSHHWKEAVLKLLAVDNENEFAVELVRNLLANDVDDLDYGDIHFAIQPVMRVVLEKYGEDVWPDIAKAIEGSGPLQEYRYTQLFGSDDHSDRGKHKSVLSSLSDEVLADWCAKTPEMAPKFVASATEVYESDNDGYRLSQRAKFLIDEYGDSDEILGALSANMGSFGWTGSVVPHYQAEVLALQPLLKHKRTNVRQWAERRTRYLNDRIEQEKVFDAEHSLGIYH